MSTYAKVIADSISEHGIRITTMELKYHRFIHSEFMTHRMFSRNASSSRAIPIEKMIKQVLENPAMPIHWGKNQPGMQAREECDEFIGGELSRESAWKCAARDAATWAKMFKDSNYHKQIVNRLLEPYQYIKVIVTATEWDNFFKLRLHTDAQPEIQELAQCMKEAIDSSTPKLLKTGDWHLPYVDVDEHRHYDCGTEYSTLEVIKCSVARCARVSYLNHDNENPDIDKDIALADKLLEAGHMSPFEHQATPMEKINKFLDYDLIDYLHKEGVTHIDRYKNYWSGNFRGWIQYRQLL